MGGIVAGALAGAGQAAERSLHTLQQQFGAEDLLKMRSEADKELATLHATLARETHAANRETDIATAGRFIEAQTPAKVAERKELLAVDTADAVRRFELLEPLQRKAAIQTAEESLRALSTPEMLKFARQQALAKHIVDPSYSLIPQADGTVVTFDSRSGKNAGVLKDTDGKPIIRKDPEEIKAATSIINMANTNLRIAQAEHKAAMADPAGDDQSRAAANAAWKAAQEESKRLSMPAYAVLYGKSGAAKAETPPNAEAPKGNDPRTMNMNYGFVNEKTGAKWVGRPGDKLDDAKNWQMPKTPKAAPKAGEKSGIVKGQIKQANAEED